jgi:HEAT repeat protein
MLVPTLATAAWLWLSLAGASQEPTLPSARLAELVASRDERAPGSLDRLAAELSALGPCAIPAMLDALRDQAIQPAEGERVALAPGPAAAVHGALAELGLDRVLPALGARLGPGASPLDRAVAVEVLGRIGTAAELGLILTAGDLPPDAQGLDPRLDRALYEALTRLFSRSSAAALAARDRLLAAPPHLAASLVRALAECDSAAGTEVLISVLGYGSLDLVVLPCLAAASARGELVELDERVRFALHAQLEGSHGMAKRSAVLAAGQLEDSTSVPLLLDLLEGQDAELGQAAHWSLCRITGLALPPRRERWRSWHAMEELWLRSEFQTCATALRGSPSEVIRALQSIGQHRLHRELLAGEVADVLDNPDPAVRRMACAILGQLGSRRSIAVLRERTGDPDPTVAGEARRALKTLEQPAPPSGSPARSPSASRR